MAESTDSCAGRRYLLDTALDEIHRVLRPGGVAWFAEPVFAGDLNEIIRLFHDEQVVRQAAFDALVRASNGGQWKQGMNGGGMREWQP